MPGFLRLSYSGQPIISAQTAEIEEMGAWLADWYDTAAEPVRIPKDERMMEMLDSLSGAEFEIAFMQEMIEHHQVAIRRAARCEVRAAHATLVDMCGTMTETQAQEIQLMSSWLCAWYECCGDTGMCSE